MARSFCVEIAWKKYFLMCFSINHSYPPSVGLVQYTHFAEKLHSFSSPHNIKWKKSQNFHSLLQLQISHRQWKPITIISYLWHQSPPAPVTKQRAIENKWENGNLTQDSNYQFQIIFGLIGFIQSSAEKHSTMLQVLSQTPHCPLITQDLCTYSKAAFI